MTLTLEVLESIRAAIQMIQNNVANRIDNEGWTVYRVGNIVRVDIKDNK